jgi:hypothetical protein
MSIMSFIRMMLKKGHLEKNGNNINRFFNFMFRYRSYQRGNQRPYLGEEQIIKWLKDKKTKGQTMVYNTLPRKLKIEYILQINLRGNDTYRAYVISDNYNKPYSHRHVETAYKTISSIKHTHQQFSILYIG